MIKSSRQLMHFLMTDKQGNCFVCKERSYTLHYDFEAYLHPDCEQQAWQMYQEALTSQPNQEVPE
jgi:hypothetical protein